MSIRNVLLEQISAQMTNLLASFVVAGRGGIGVDAVVPIGSVNTTPQIVDGFDTEIIENTRGITQLPLTNNGLIFDVEGVWNISVKVTLTFDEVNAGRTMNLRFYNATTMTPGAVDFVYFIGRNTGGVNLTVTLPVEISVAESGDLQQLQIFTDGDLFTNVTNIGSTFTAIHSSEAQFL